MAGGDVGRSSTKEDGLPVSPSLGPALAAAHVPTRGSSVDPRVIYIAFLSLLVGLAAGVMARALIYVIRLITNVSFHGRLSWAPRLHDHSI